MGSFLDPMADKVLIATLFLSLTYMDLIPGRHISDKFIAALYCQQYCQGSIQINHPTRCNNFSSLLLGVYLQLNMFWVSSRPSSGAQQLQQQPLVLPSERGVSAVG